MTDKKSEALPELMGHHVGYPTVALGASALSGIRSAEPRTECPNANHSAHELTPGAFWCVGKILLSGLCLALVLVVGIGCNLTKTNTNQDSINQNQSVEVKQGVQVTINFGDSQETLTARVTEATTALAVLQQVTQDNGIALETKEYDFGVSIEKIGEKQGGENSSYWLFNYNGTPAQVGVSQQQINPGDSLEFVYSKM